MGCQGGNDTGRILKTLDEITGKRVHLASFGCTYNLATTLRLRDILLSQGCTIVSEADAEVVFVNTCTVIGRTERQVLARLRSITTKNLIVMGCMVRTQMDRIHEVCSPWTLPDYVVAACAPLPGSMNGGAIGIVQIAEGCNGSCRYCIARTARGRLRSQPEEIISETVRMLINRGAREVQLTAQDVASWGIDNGRSLPDLLRLLLHLPGSFRLRLGMMNPRTLLPLIDDLIPLLSHPKMFQFIHVPFQSGSDEILTAMDRGYTRDQCLAIVNTLRSAYPELWLSTDVIVGYPGESDGAFSETVDLIETIRPEKVNITRFSPRPGTHAWALPGILERVKKERSRTLTKRCTAMCREKNQVWIGKTVPVIAVEEVKRGSVTCRTPQYRSVVLHDPLPLGAEGLVRVTGERTHFLTGELIEACGQPRSVTI